MEVFEQLRRQSWDTNKCMITYIKYEREMVEERLGDTTKA